MAVQFLDPRADAGAAVEPYELSLDLTDGPISIGLLANGFPDSERFLDKVEKELAHLVPGATFHRYNKGNASITVPDDMLSSIVSECSAVVAAYGH